ncbi:MAG: YraN family protein [Steroidobacteraceae bacterium]|nr:YraN family protein [Nevskiaceae bacterium]
MRSTPDRNALGRRAEDLVAAAVLECGATLLLRNYRRRCGELDLVACERGVLRIIEVRMRSDDRFGGGAASVDQGKRRRIITTTRQLLQQRPELAKLPVRFDVAVVTPGLSRWQIEWIPHAFEAG